MTCSAFSVRNCSEVLVWYRSKLQNSYDVTETAGGGGGESYSVTLTLTASRKKTDRMCKAQPVGISFIQRAITTKLSQSNLAWRKAPLCIAFKMMLVVSSLYSTRNTTHTIPYSNFIIIIINKIWKQENTRSTFCKYVMSLGNAEIIVLKHTPIMERL